MPGNKEFSEPHPVEFDAQKANSISLALNTLADDLRRNDHPQAETVREFAERFGEARVEASDPDSDTVTLNFPAEGYRMMAAMVRMDGFFRKSRASDRDYIDSIGMTIADDRLELARILDEAARDAESDE